MSVADAADGATAGESPRRNPVRRLKCLLVVAVFCLWSAGLLYAQVQQAEQTPADLLRNFKSIYVNANTVYIKNGVTEGAILKELQKKHLDLEIAIKTDRSADAVLTVERQAVWPQWDYSYRMVHEATGVVLAAGKVRTIDGGSAAKKIAEQVVSRIAQVRTVEKKN
jgi:uncharacterized protein YchJ